MGRTRNFGGNTVRFNQGVVASGSSSDNGGFSLAVTGSAWLQTLSGSLTHLADGTSYLVAGSNVTITSGTNGSVTIASSGGGGGGISFDGSTANGILTYKDSDEATVETNMTFDGNTLTVSGDVDGSYVAVLDNDENTNGHVLKLLTDGNGSGSRLLEMEDGDGDVLFRARADGRFGFGPDGVSSMGAGTFVVGIANSSHTADIAISQRLQHLGDSNTYMDFPSNDNITFAAGGSEELKIASDAILVKQYIKHDGDENTHIQFADNKIILKAGNLSFFKSEKKNSAPHEITLNDGSNNIDFIVKGNGSNQGNPGMKFDASTNKLGINGVGTPSWELDVAGDIGLAEYIYHRTDTDTFIRFEDDSISIEAGGKSMVKVIESSIDQVLIMSGGAGSSLNPTTFSDTNFFVSGTIGSRGTVNPGTSVFGGDSVVSGNLYVQDTAGLYADKIRRFSDSDNTTKILLNDELLKFYAGHSTEDIVRIGETNKGNDNNFWVSGSVGSKGSADRGTAAFGGDLVVSGTLHIGSAFKFPTSDGSNNQVMKTDGSGNLSWADQSGGGSSSDTFVMFQQIEQVNNLSTSYYYYKIVTGGYGWTNSFSPTNFSTSFPYWRIHRYASSGTVPVNCSMTKYRIAGHKDGSDNDTITIKIWKVPAATHGDSETDIPTLVEVVSVEVNADANQIINKNAAISSNNSFSAGDSWFVTINPTSAYMTSDHYMQLSVEFTVS